ncbi:MBOAT family O-acyltransferase [Tardiphaga sp.]|jgi:alginate O-acetyltransferase complex protein AlgI|uniref:MBOAT family O-acyltransferase n=1 Tax=Tardiphaga sp. TaxID=1926292 RepID=UPI0037D9976D
MTFTSWQFGAFTAIVLTLYYSPVFGRLQVPLLVASSILFYAFDQPSLLVLLLVAVLGTHAFLILSYRNRQVWLPLGIAFNLLLLAFFKYKFLFLNLPIQTNSVVGDILLNAPLPIGISFFVFHNISLMVDLTKADRKQPSVAETFLYIIFFPQLVSGPITRAEVFMPQIVRKRFADIDVVEAAKWIIIGYFFKLFVANNLNEITANMDYPAFGLVQAADRWLLVFTYSAQIYADFFGYSSIAVGLGLLFGYRLADNFNLPYKSKSFSEFWTRWHISLSTWLRNYLYIPLGGNRHGTVRTCINLMIVMSLGGLWHGAGLSYLVWGFLHGGLLVVERPFLPLLNKISHPALALARALVVFVCVSFLWIFFKLPSFEHAASYIYGMLFGVTNLENPAKVYRTLAIVYALPVVIQHTSDLRGLLATKCRHVEPFAYGALVALMFVEAGPDSSFIYFQF